MIDRSPADFREEGYGLTILMISDRFLVRLEADEYRRMSRAAALVKFALSVEEKFDILLMNYADFESALDQMVGDLKVGPPQQRDINRQRRVANKATINLLNTARLYCDHLTVGLGAAYDKGAWVLGELKRICSSEYDATDPTYRIMTALRNYAQHREVPVDVMRYRLSRDRNDQTKTMYEVTFEADTFAIVSDGSFKASVVPALNETSKQGRVDLRPLTKRYVAALTRIHMSIRNLVAEDLARAEVVIADTRRLAEQRIADPVVNLGPFSVDKLAGLSVTMVTPRKSKRWWVSSAPSERRLDMISEQADYSAIAKRFGWED